MEIVVSQFFNVLLSLGELKPQLVIVLLLILQRDLLLGVDNHLQVILLLQPANGVSVLDMLALLGLLFPLSLQLLLQLNDLAGLVVQFLLEPVD